MSLSPSPWSVSEKRVYVKDAHGENVCAVSRHDDVPLIASAPELLACCIELKTACAAAMRVIADLDAMKVLGAESETREQRFVNELKVSGVVNGFGVRAEKAIAKAEGR